jgi:hypothetical protein
MSAVKKTRETERQFYYQQKTVDLSVQERQALSLVWLDNSDAEEKAQMSDAETPAETSHCAVLGYN